MKRTTLSTALLALLSACEPAAKQPNVVLISIDTLRADHVGAYGHPGDITPHLDALASEAVRFEEILSPVPLTLPAHSSMLTGAIPPVHGIHDNLSTGLSDDVLTLAELFKASGYTTGAVVSSFVLDARFNLDQGFDFYDDDFREEHKIAFLSERKGDETALVATDWIRANQESPFFLFLHFYDPHDDYAPPEPFASRFEDDPYAGEVAFTDAMVGRVIDQLRELDLFDSTIIAVTGDHGEMLGEHGELTHGFFLYESALAVPFILKAPGLAPSVVSERAGLIDVAPTLAGLAGLRFDDSVQGRDLNLTGESSPADYFIESVTANRYYDTNTLVGLVSRNWKYIHTTRPELYDLDADPNESDNVVAANERIARGMTERIEEMLRVERNTAGAPAALDDEARRRLAALGYLSSATGDVDLTIETERDDPKDWIAFYLEHQELEKLVGDGAYETAKALALRLVDDQPSFVAGYFQLARIATETNDLSQASIYYERALELDPDNAGAHFNLANILRTLGRSEEAFSHYARATELDPGLENPLAASNVAKEGPAASELSEARSHHLRGLELRRRGELPEALSELESAVRLDPGFAQARSDLGVVLKQLGRTDEAIQQYEAALRIDPELAEVHNNMGSLLGSEGELGRAVEHFRLAIRAEPGHAEAQNNLGLALRMSGGRDEAVAHFRAALDARADWPVPMNELAWILATHPRAADRAPAEALELAQRAVSLSGGRQPVFLDTLAAAYAANGDFAAAVRTAEQAVAAASGAPRLAQEMTGRLEAYRRSQPFVEPESRARP